MAFYILTRFVFCKILTFVRREAVARYCSGVARPGPTRACALPSTFLVWRSQTHYALANLLDGALAVKGLGTYAWPARARGMQLNERIK